MTWTSIYSVLLQSHYTFWNAFGYDRAATQFYFASPVPFRLVLRAKNVAAACVQALELLLITAAFLVLPFPFRLSALVEAVAVTATTCLFLFAVGNMLSVFYSTPFDPDKMSGGGGSRSTFMLPLTFLPVALAYWGGYVFGSQPIFYALLLVVALIGALAYRIGTDSALEYVQTNREKMIIALSRGAGPLSIT